MEPSSNVQEPHGLTRRSCVSTREASSNAQEEPRNSLDLSLYVKWHGEEGQSQIHRLKLSSLDKVESLQVRVQRTRSGYWVAAGAHRCGNPLHGVAGRSRKPTCRAVLQALPKQLVSKAYERRAMPDHFTSAAYQKFTPQTECLSIPGEQQQAAGAPWPPCSPIAP